MCSWLRIEGRRHVCAPKPSPHCNCQTKVGVGCEIRHQRIRNRILSGIAAEPGSVDAGLVSIDVGGNVVGMVALIRNSHSDAFPNLPLQSEVPFLHDRAFVFNLVSQVEELRSRLGDVGGGRIRKRKDREAIVADGIGENPTSLDPTDHPLMALALKRVSMNRP